MRIPLWFTILTLLAGCTSAPPDGPWECGTPADAEAPADVVMTARDVALQPAAGRTFIAWTYDGDVPGPVLRMNLGETRRIKLLNRGPRPLSLHFHGVRYEIQDDGSPHRPEGMVNPGCAHVYTVTAVQPGVWPYHSHRASRSELARGLYGAVVVPAAGEAPAREFVVFLGELGQEEAAGEEGEGAGGGGHAGHEASPEGTGASFYMTVNGRPGGDLERARTIELVGDTYVARSGVEPGARVGDRVRFRVLNVSPDQPHTFHLHGHRFCQGASLEADGSCPRGAEPVDNVSLLPAQGISAEFTEDNPGVWMYHCHVLDHVLDGMFGYYHVAGG